MSAVAEPAPGRTQIALRRLVAKLRDNTTPLLSTLIVAVLVVPPLIVVVLASFASEDTGIQAPQTLEHYERVFAAGTGVRMILNTLLFAVGTAVLSVAMAAVVAFLAERTNAPFRRLVYATVIIGFGVPTIIQTMGWIFLIGPNSSVVNSLLTSVFGEGAPQVNLLSMAGMIFVQATVLFPAMFLLVAPSFRMSDPALEHAASVSGAGRWRVARSITFPLAAPSLLAAVLLAFIIAVESFEVPALIGTPAKVNVISTAIYSRLKSFSPDFGSAAALATLLMILTIIGLWFYQRAISRASKYATVTGKGYRPDKLDLGRLRWLAAIPMLGLPALILAPIAILAWTSLLPSYVAPALDQLGNLSLANYSEALSKPAFRDALWNTIVLAIGAAIIVMLITLATSWSVIRRRSLLTRVVDQLATLPLVIPGVVLSLAILRLFVDFPLQVYGTLWILLIAFVIHYLPYGQRYNQAGLVALHNELEEAANVSGANRLQVFARIVAPLIRPTLLAGALFVFLASMRQLSLVVFVTTPDTNVVASVMFDMWTNGDLADAATAAMLVTALVLVVAVVLYRVAGLGREDGAKLEIR